MQSFQSEEAIQPGIFWLSNVHEILSFVCIAENDILQGIGPGVDGSGREFDWDDYERLVGIVKHDLDSLEYNIYHTWIQETKKKLSKMIVPALIESQSLPGFVTNDGGGRLFNRLLQSNNTPTFTMDDLLNILNKVWKCLKSYYVEQSVIQQVTTELLKLIGVVSFNDLVMRRNFCSWKRGEYYSWARLSPAADCVLKPCKSSITSPGLCSPGTAPTSHAHDLSFRLEEWCKSHVSPLPIW